MKLRTSNQCRKQCERYQNHQGNASVPQMRNVVDGKGKVLDTELTEQFYSMGHFSICFRKKDFISLLPKNRIPFHWN